MSAIGIPVDIQLTGETPEELAATARQAENAGLARIWSPELQRSATIPLAIVAAATERIEIATGIALAFTRSPMVFALEALDLDQLSGGRMVIGLGAGVRRLNMSWHGAHYDPPLGRMRELLDAVDELVQAMAEGRDARSPGRHYDIAVVGFRRTAPAPRARIPIWLAAVLPGMAGVAGSRAEGLLDHPITTPEWLDEILRPAVARGAERAEREPPLIAGALTCAVDDDRDRALRAAALTVGFYATVKTYERLFAMHGFSGRLKRIRKAFLGREPDALIDAVGAEMTERFAAAGSADEVRDRARRAYASGCARLWATPPHHLQSPEDIAHWQTGICRAFGR
ncbi:MAG: LLM class flavin-dependent oxidoreductase [Thermoleophilia bacterium]|nr:LLM class flavin-dependent oxidoreductase [Thermoleophilia bacterium]